MKNFEWKIFWTAVLVTITRTAMWIGGIAAAIVIAVGLFYGAWELIKAIYKGFVWLYENLTLTSFLWFCGIVAFLIIVTVNVHKNYLMVKRNKKRKFWDKVMNG